MKKPVVEEQQKREELQQLTRSEVAEQFSEIHIDELLKSYGDSWDMAGKNMVIDGPALALIKKESLKSVVVNGLHLDEFERAILGKSFVGTVIKV